MDSTGLSRLKSMIIAAVTTASLAQLGCSTAPANVRQVHNLIPASVRWRRPAGPGADPQAGPGGWDYTSHPLPDAHWDCKRPYDVLGQLPIYPIQACLNSLKKPLEISFELNDDFSPGLDLEVSSDQPACLLATLKRIPIPREIIFQEAQSPYACASARLSLEADQFKMIRPPFRTAILKIQLPLAAPLLTGGETVRLLEGWALSAFPDPSTRSFPSQLVPDSICRQCLGEEPWRPREDEPPESWPVPRSP